MLKELISDRICFKNSVSSWEEAVTLSCTPLLTSGCITQGYIEAIISNVREFGPYFVLTDGIAMPHARPENGALKTAMSFLSIKEGVLFPDTEAPVYLLFGLAAADSNSHIDAMMQLADLAGNEAGLASLQGCKSADTLHKIIG